MKERFGMLRSLKPRYVRGMLVFFFAGAFGVALLLTSRAATPTASLEAEAGSVTGVASGVSDSTASGNAALEFGLAATCTGTPGAPGGTDPWGGCWPGPSNTGVPAGTTLTTVNSDLTVTTDNSTVSGKNVVGCINVLAVGVTIQNSKAKCITVSNSASGRDPANARLTIQDSEVDCGGTAGTTAISDQNINVYRVNIHGCENGFDMDAYATIRDSYIHDLFNAPDAPGSPHTDGLQSAVGNFLILDHNVVYGFDTGCVYPNGTGSCNGTSAVNIFNAPTGPAVHDTTVSKNLLAGGAYSLYCPRVSTTNFNIVNNHFSTVYSPNVGEYGPSSDCAGETQYGNVIHETGQSITLE